MDQGPLCTLQSLWNSWTKRWGGVGGGLVMSEVQPLITTTLSNPLGIYIYNISLYMTNLSDGD